MNTMKFYFTILATFLFFNISFSQNNYLEAYVTLLGFDNVTNEYFIEYEDDGQNSYNPNIPSATPSFYYKLIVNLRDNAGTVVYSQVLHNHFYEAQVGGTWSTIGYVQYTVALPSSLACSDYDLDIKVEINGPQATQGDISIYTDIQDTSMSSISGHQFIIEGMIADQYTFAQVDNITKSSSCPLLVTLSQFGNTINSTIAGSVGNLTYQWTTWKGGTIVSNNGASVVLGSAGIYCLTVTDALGNTATGCIRIINYLSFRKLGSLEPSDKETLSISIYPNPTSDELFITNLNEPLSTILISNTLGQTIQSTNLLIGNSIDVSTLDKGLYFIQFLTKDEKQIIPFVKE